MFSNKFGKYSEVECGLVCVIEDDHRHITKPIPLVSVDVVATIVHAVAHVEVNQVYVNKEENPIEAIYYFPVDSNGGVTHFQAELEGRVIKGIVKESEEAKATYEKAIKEQQTAFIVESNKPDIFKVKIGFLKPGTQVKISIGYVTEVKNEANAIRFFIPTTVAPRYVPADNNDEKSKDLKNMQFSATSPAAMTIKVNISLQGEISSIESPTHKIKVSEKGPNPLKKNWTKAAVELEGNSTDMDRDFVLLIKPADKHFPRLYREKLENSVAVMAHLIPSFKLNDQKAELIFILDRSGSMMGNSIEMAKGALSLFLHSMPMDCYFNIVGFGSSYQLLYPESKKYDDGSLKTAIEHSKTLQADLGGTEIYQPLKTVFEMKEIKGYLRQIFILTDGEVGNTDQVIGVVKNKAHESRVFTLGIGDGASHHLVEGIAEAGGGTSAFVTYKESFNAKVLQQLKNALQPSLTNVTVNWHGLPNETNLPEPMEVETEKTLMGYGKPKEVEGKTDNVPKSFIQVPEKIPPIYDGSQLIVFGIFKDKEPTGATITAESPDGPLSIDINLSEDNDVGGTGHVHKLASIKTIRELEMKVAGIPMEKSQDEAEAMEKALKKTIVEIACKEGLGSKYTSFIAVVEGETGNENWAMQTRYVPSQYAHGWHGMVMRSNAYLCGSGGGQMSGFQPQRLQLRSKSQPKIRARLSGPPSARSTRSAMKRMDELDCGQVQMSANRMASYTTSREKARPTKVPETDLDRVNAIVGLQSFDGSFILDDNFAKTIKKSLDSLSKEAKNMKWDEKAWATALAVAYLEVMLSREKDSWELVATKAEKWIQKNFAKDYNDMIDAAVKVFGTK